MTRASLLNILDHVTGISEAEVRELEQLATAFPYCQTAHLLLAKAAHDRGNMLAGQRLRRAATYAADRELLRLLIEQPALLPASPALQAAPDAAPLTRPSASAELLPTTANEAASSLTPETAPSEAPTDDVLSVSLLTASAEPATPTAPDASTPSAETLASAEAATLLPATPEAQPEPTEPTDEAATPESAQEAEPAAETPVAEADAVDAPAVSAPASEPATAAIAQEAADNEPAELPTPDAPTTPEPDAEAAIEATAQAEPEAPTSEAAAEATATEPVAEPAETADEAATPGPAQASPTVEELPAADDAAEAPVTAASTAFETTDEAVETDQSHIVAPEATAEQATAEAPSQEAEPATTAAALAAAASLNAARPAAATLAAAAAGLAGLTASDELPATAPPIRPPADAGSSRFEFGLSDDPLPTSAYQLGELTNEADDDTPTTPPVYPPYRADELLAYALLAGGSRLGPALTLRDAELTTDQPSTDTWQPDAATQAHYAAHRPTPAPAPSTLVLIDRFLRSQPRIKASVPRPQPTETPQADLSVRSTSATPSIASESLAKIMIRQGKIGRAIEIYEQLMQRQPEKKAYFAAQIDLLNQQPE